LKREGFGVGEVTDLVEIVIPWEMEMEWEFSARKVISGLGVKKVGKNVAAGMMKYHIGY